MRLNSITLLLLLICNYSKAATANNTNLIINEIMASNLEEYLDLSINYGSWVELYNPTSESVALGGLYISDDPANLKKNRLISNYGSVPAHGYAILSFDHFDVFTAKSYRQINDKLSNAGGTIIISDGTNIIVQQDYPVAVPRSSYARKADGGSEWGLTVSPSPGSSNVMSVFATESLPNPEPSIPGQLFKGTLSLNVPIPSGATLRYTTNGTVPTMKNGNTSTTGDFNIIATTVYRFRFYKDGYLPSQVVARSYILNSGNEPFPIISVVCNPDHIFDSPNAIFAKSENGRKGNGQNVALNQNMDWDRPVNFEYIPTTGIAVINQECDFSACGGWSRAFEPHSFKLKANKLYHGLNSFDYQFFKEKPYIKNRTLQIRNGGNDTECRIKDAALQEIACRSGLYIDHQAWQPVHVYINGNPYAILNMREPNNKHYATANYGLDSDYLDQFEISPDSGYVQKEGTKDAFMKLYELSKTASSEDSYEEIKKLVDIDEYINYMAVEMYLGGTDWGRNNVKGFRDQNDGKFHFVLFDLDSAGETNTPLTAFANKKRWIFDRLYGYDYSKGKSIEGTRQTKEIEFVTIFLNMLKNTTFKKQFVDAMCLVGGAVYTPERVSSIIDEMVAYMRQGNYINPTKTATDLKNMFGASRQSTIANHVRNYGLTTATRQAASFSSNIPEASITYNGQPVPTGKFSGYIFAPVELKAEAPAGYRFLGWKSSTNSIVSTSEAYTLPKSGSINVTAVWEKETDDITLKEKRCVPIKINEVSAGNSMAINEYIKKNDWVELYNTTDVTLDVEGLCISDNLSKPSKCTISGNGTANTKIGPKGHLIVWCDKLDTQTQLHASFKLGNDEVSDRLDQVVMISSSKAFVNNNKEYFDAHPEMSEFTDTLTYNKHLGTESVGRYPDGSTTYYVFNHPTPGAANSRQLSDIFMAEELPWIKPTPTAISITETIPQAVYTEIYTIDGLRTNNYQRGVNVIKLPDGKSRKIIIK